jgi:membrane protein
MAKRDRDSGREVSGVPAARSSVPQTLKHAFVAFIDDDVFTLAAALAYYTALSFAPLLVLSLWLTASQGPAVRDAIIEQIGTLGGAEAQSTAESIIENAHSEPALGSVAGIIGIAVLLLGATTVFAQLQASLNVIWKVDAPPTSGIATWLRRRVVSIGLFGATLFVLAVSLVVSALLAMFLSHTGYVWQIVNQIVSLGVLTILFASLFRYLPDVRLQWRDTLAGGFVASALFALGKLVISWYLARSNLGSAYGPAGSIIVFLAWVYYSSMIFLFGAELIKSQFVDWHDAYPPRKTADTLGGSAKESRTAEHA